MLNEGMFVGSKGYVLKPPGYRGDGVETRGKEEAGKDAVKSQATAVEHKTLDLSIEILAAQDIPLPLGDTKPDSFHPYVKIELHVEKPAERTGAPIEGGGRAKEGEYKWRGRTVRGTGAGTGVDFEGEKVVWRGIEGVVEELGFIRYVSDIPYYAGSSFCCNLGNSPGCLMETFHASPPHVTHHIILSFHTSHQLQSIFTSLHKHIIPPFNNPPTKPLPLTLPQVQNPRRQNRQRHPRSLGLHPPRPPPKRVSIRAFTDWCGR